MHGSRAESLAVISSDVKNARFSISSCDGLAVRRSTWCLVISHDAHNAFVAEVEVTEQGLSRAAANPVSRSQQATFPFPFPWFIQRTSDN